MSAAHYDRENGNEKGRKNQRENDMIIPVINTIVRFPHFRRELSALIDLSIQKTMIDRDFAKDRVETTPFLEIIGVKGEEKPLMLNTVEINITVQDITYPIEAALMPDLEKNTGFKMIFCGKDINADVYFSVFCPKRKHARGRWS